MDQQCFEFMLEELPEVVFLEDRLKEELFYQMANAIVEVFKNEGRKTDDNSSE